MWRHPKTVPLVDHRVHLLNSREDETVVQQRGMHECVVLGRHLPSHVGLKRK